MGLYLFERIAVAVGQLVVATFVLFTLFFIAPSSDLSVAGSFETGHEAGQVGRFEGSRSALAEYVRFLQHLAHGELGRSTRTNQEVTHLVAQAWPATASLVVGGLLLWLVLALVIGLASAMWPRSPVDRFGSLLVFAGASFHPLVLSLLLSWLFGYKLRWLPFQGYCDVFNPSRAQCGGPVQWACHLVLPWIAVGAGFGALYTRMIRASVSETLSEDFVRTARGKGASELAVLRHHALRVSMLPLVTMLTMDLGVVFGGTIFVERAFHLPGLGSLLAQSVTRPDEPVILGVMLIVAALALALSLLLDVLCAVVDPRVTVIRLRKPRRIRFGSRAATSEPLPQTR